MTNIILVAGTYFGGWYWDPIIPALHEAGHKTFTPTLAGLDSTQPYGSPINLDTHIDQVVRIVEENDLDELVLVGWSYAGMVITGAADRVRARVRKIFYLDAQLPNPGEREWDLIPTVEHEMFIDQCSDGLNLYPDAGLLAYESRMQPHPLATKLQPVQYDQSKFDSLSKVFVFAEKWFNEPGAESPIKKSFDRARAASGWETESWPFGHDLVREAASKVATLITTRLGD